MFSLIWNKPKHTLWVVVPRKVNFMVSLKSYRIQLSSASCNYGFSENGFIRFLKMHCTWFTPCLVGVSFVVLYPSTTLNKYVHTKRTQLCHYLRTILATPILSCDSPSVLSHQYCTNLWCSTNVAGENRLKCACIALQRMYLQIP